MIEINSEVMTDPAMSNEIAGDENDFLRHLNKNKKEKKIDDREIIIFGLLNPSPDLYGKTSIAGGGVAIVTDNKKSDHPLASEMMQGEQRRKAISKSVLGISEVTSAPAMEPSGLHGSIATSLGADIPGHSIYLSDEETNEQQDIVKIHSVTLQPKNDVMAQHKELQHQEMKFRAQQALIAERILQVNAGIPVSGTALEKQSVNIEYPFLRWSGEHSVKVSISSEVRHERHLTLLPSDVRAAEVLSRQVGQLNGYSTALLHPHPNDDESERRHPRQEWEEEQE